MPPTCRDARHPGRESSVDANPEPFATMSDDGLLSLRSRNALSCLEPRSSDAWSQKGWCMPQGIEFDDEIQNKRIVFEDPCTVNGIEKTQCPAVSRSKLPLRQRRMESELPFRR